MVFIISFRNYEIMDTNDHTCQLSDSFVKNSECYDFIRNFIANSDLELLSSGTLLKNHSLKYFILKLSLIIMLRIFKLYSKYL